MFNGKTHYQWPFSIALLNYQRVYFMGFIASKMLELTESILISEHTLALLADNTQCWTMHRQDFTALVIPETAIGSLDHVRRSEQKTWDT